MHTEKLQGYWKPFADGTEILMMNGVQIASIQETDNDEYEVYIYDSDFEEVFKSLAGTTDKDKQLLKDLVGRLFLDWLEKSYKELNGLKLVH